MSVSPAGGARAPGSCFLFGRYPPICLYKAEGAKRPSPRHQFTDGRRDGIKMNRHCRFIFTRGILKKINNK